jgi:hypothetical protein
MKKSLITVLFLFICIFAWNNAFAQTRKQPTKKAKTSTKVIDNKKMTRVRTIDENEYIGEKISEDSLYVTLQTKTVGKIAIPKSGIEKMDEVSSDQLKKGNFLIENAHSSRYFWQPNGFGLKKGEGYYQNTWVLLNQVSYGFTDNFTMGVGTVPLFLFSSGVNLVPFWVTPKFQFEAKDNVNIGLGMIYGGVLSTSSGDSYAGGIAYGVSTFGDRNKNLSIGVGFGFADGQFVKKPNVTISGMYRVGKRTYLMAENWFIPIEDSNVGVVSLGGRYTAKTLAFDFGLISFIYDGERAAGPWLGVNVPFGKRIKE